MGESMSKAAAYPNLCCRQHSTEGRTPLGNCIKITVIRRKTADGSLSPHERRKRAKSYENVFKRESDFFRKTIRQPYELGSKLLTRNALSFDDLTKIESHDVIGEQTQILIEVVRRKDCFIELYEVLLEEESPLVDYLEIKSNTKEYVSDGEFVRRLGLRAYLTENDRKVLKKYYRYITKNTSNADDIFTHLFQDGILDDVTIEKLSHMHSETAKMEYFVQSNMSRWTYSELKAFCDILMEENSHVAKVLWPIVSTVDPSAARKGTEEVCVMLGDFDIELDTKFENTALKVCKEKSTNRQTSIVLGNHGEVTEVKTGSIKITMVIQTLESLHQLQRDIESGCMQHRFKEWIISNAEKDLSQFVVKACLDDNEMMHAERILLAHFNDIQREGTLESSVQFGFCKERGEWFWSHDGAVWMHITRLRIPAGPHANKVPLEEDIQIIQMLAKQRIPLTRPVTPCPVCTMGKLAVENENIYGELRQSESLHAGVPVTITFNMYRHQQPAEPAGTPSKKTGASPSKSRSFLEKIGASPKKTRFSPKRESPSLKKKENSHETGTIGEKMGKIEISSEVEASGKKVQPDISMNMDLALENATINQNIYSSQRQDSHSHSHSNGCSQSSDISLNQSNDTLQNQSSDSINIQFNEDINLKKLDNSQSETSDFSPTRSHDKSNNEALDQLSDMDKGMADALHLCEELKFMDDSRNSNEFRETVV